MTQLAVVHASQLLTLAGPDRGRRGDELAELGIVTDGAMIIRDGLVAWTGKTDSMPRSEGEVIDASGKVVMPGFVDAHTHVVFAGDRLDEFEIRCRGATYEEIAKVGGIRSTVVKTRAATEDELVEASARRVRWMIAGGTTSIEVKSGYGLSLDSEMKILRAIKRLPALTGIRCTATFLGAHAVPPEFEGLKKPYVSEILKMIDQVADQELAQFCDIFVEKGYFDADDARLILGRAKQRGLGIRMHVDQLHRSGGAELAAELGATTADHLEHTEIDGIQALVSANVTPVLLPGSVYALGKNRYPAAREMIAAGLPIVIATDFNPGSSPGPSMPMTMSLACCQMGLSPAEAVTAATVNAAHSLGKGHEIGTLEPGRQADFAIHDCADFRELAYYFGFNRAEAVFVGGRKVHPL